jgi:hypothetical protein
VYVDCTGLGLLSCDTAQPISVCTSFVMTGVKEKEVAAYLSDHPDEVRSSFNPSETLLSVQGFASTLACAKETGESLANLQSITLDPGFRPDEVIVRVNHPEKINPLELAPITATELWAQNISIHLAAALRKLVPGFKDSRILMTPAQIGFLGSFRYLPAQATVKEKAEASHLPFRPQWLVAGNATNLLCAGRAVLQAMGLTSPTNFAALSMATGEIAGRIAAQCVREKISPVKLFALEKI